MPLTSLLLTLSLLPLTPLPPSLSHDSVGDSEFDQHGNHVPTAQALVPKIAKAMLTARCRRRESQRRARRAANAQRRVSSVMLANL